MVMKISTEAINEDFEDSKGAENTTKQNNTVDMSKFLDVFPEQGQTEKKLTIRILPITEEGKIFDSFTCHDLTVVPSEKFSRGVYKTFMCASNKTNEEGVPEKCPICEANKYYWELVDKTKKEMDSNKEALVLSPNAQNLEHISALTEKIKKQQEEIDQYKKWATPFRKKTYYVLRCIDRSKPDEGPKFWRFPENKDKDGIRDKIIELYNSNYRSLIDPDGKDEPANWKKRNIFALDETGYDIIVKIKLNDKGKRTFSFSRAEDPRPLSTKQEQLDAWDADTTTWKDLYAIKSYDYLSAVIKSGGRAPLWDKDNRRFIPDMRNTSKQVSMPTQSQSAEQQAQPQQTVAQAPVQSPAPATAPAQPQQAPAQPANDGSDLPF